MNPRILIVDDSLTVRMDLAEASERAGFETRLCPTLAEARQALLVDGFDLIILDVMLPDGDGVDFLGELRTDERTAPIPVILLSTKAEVESRIAGLEEGADDYLGKPYESSQVIQRVGELIQRRRPDRSRQKILVIDDSLTFCQEMSQQLESAGYEILIAATGEDGLRKAAASRPDAIIVDGQLPGIDGSGVVRRLRMDPGLHLTPCLYLTGADSAADEMTALDAGADAYIRKDEGSGVVLGRLAALLRSTKLSRANEFGEGTLAGKKILLLSCNQTMSEWLPPVLRQDAHDVVVSPSEEDAFRLLAIQPTDCVLVDAGEPAWLLDLCRRFKALPLLRPVPLIVLGESEDQELVVSAMEAGADDWIASRAANPHLLLARVRSLLRRKELEDRERRLRHEFVHRTVELEQANQELGLFKEVVDQIPIGVALAHWESPPDLSSFRLVLSNPASELATQRSAADCIGHTFGDAFPELLETDLPSRCAAAIETRRPQHLTRREGTPERIWDVQVAPLSGHRVAILSQDVTEREQAEEKRRKLEEQMEVAQRLETLGQLTGGVAHDFNNLLTVISGNLELLERRCRDAPQLEKPVASALKAARGGADLTGRLLAFARRQPLNLSQIDPNELVSATVELIRRTLGSEIEIALRLSEDMWSIHSDASQLENCLINLAVNARDAMGSRGQLTFETAITVLEPEYAKRSFGVEPGPYVMIAVTDTGSGMPPEVQRRAFDPFFSTKERGKGTGLGLSMVHGFVKQSGGHIQIYSEEGAGTTIRLHLPRSESSEKSMPCDVPLRGEAPGGSETILVVDDDAEVLRIAVEFLHELGYRVLTAEDGASALRIFESNSEVDLLLTDVVMPGGMNGRELGIEVLQRRPDLAVVYISGHAEYSVFRTEALGSRERFVAKPYSRRSLAQAVRDALDSEVKE